MSIKNFVEIFFWLSALLTVMNTILDINNKINKKNPKKLIVMIITFSICIACAVAIHQAEADEIITAEDMNHYKHVESEGYGYEIDIPVLFEEQEVSESDSKSSYRSYYLADKNIQLSLNACRYEEKNLNEELYNAQQDELENRSGASYNTMNEDITKLKQDNYRRISYTKDNNIYFIKYILNDRYICNMKLIYPETERELMEKVRTDIGGSCVSKMELSFCCN